MSERQRIQQLLAGCVVEPKLEQGYPRLVRSEPLPFRPIYLFLWSAFLTGSGDFLRWRIAWIEKLFFWTVTLAFAALSVVSAIRIVRRLQDRFHIPLLRYGRAVPAVVTDVRIAAGQTWIDFAYLDRYGDLQIGSQRVNKPRQRWKHYGPGSRFTLLVLPEDETRVLPYFLAREYDVVPIEATAVSQRVTAQVAAREALVLRHLAHAHEWIEPELLGATPRSAVIRDSFHSAWWHSFAFAAFATLCVVFWQTLGQFTKQYGNYHFLISIPYVFWIIRNTVVPSEQNRQMHLLREGIAVRAEACSVNFVHGLSRNTDPPATVIYRYTATDGSVHQQSVTVNRRRLWQLGIIGGASFTVLYHRDRPDVSVPYFALDKAEIVNAFGAKITPPPTTP